MIMSVNLKCYNWTDTIQASRGEKKELKFSLIIVLSGSLDQNIYSSNQRCFLSQAMHRSNKRASPQTSILQGTSCDVISTPWYIFYDNTNTIDSKFKCTCDSSESFENSVLWRFNHTCFGIEKWEIEHSFNDFIIVLIEVLYILKGRRKNDIRYNLNSFIHYLKNVAIHSIFAYSRVQ